MHSVYHLPYQFAVIALMLVMLAALLIYWHDRKSGAAHGISLENSLFFAGLQAFSIFVNLLVIVV